MKKWDELKEWAEGRKFEYAHNATTYSVLHLHEMNDLLDKMHWLENIEYCEGLDAAGY